MVGHYWHCWKQSVEFDFSQPPKKLLPKKFLLYKATDSVFAKSRLKFIGKEVLWNGLLCVQCVPIKEIKFVAQSVTAFQSSTQKSKCWESRIVIYFLQILLEVKTKLHEITNKLSWFSCNLSSTLLLAVVLLFEFCMQLSIKLTNSCKGLNFSKCQLVNVKISSHFSAISIDDQCETKTNGISFLFTNGFLNASYQKSTTACEISQRRPF